MKPKLPLYLLTALLAGLPCSTVSAAGLEINLQDTSASYEQINDSSDSGSIPFVIDHAVLDVNGSIILFNRTASVSNSSKLTTGRDVQLSNGTFELNSSEWTIGGNLTLTDFSPALGGSMIIDNGIMNINGLISLNHGASMTVTGNSMITSGGALNLTSASGQAAILNLEGKGVSFTTGSVNINDYSQKGAQLNIKGASFISEGKASFDWASVNLQEEGTIKADSFFMNNTMNLTMTAKTSISTTGSISINMNQADSVFTANGAALSSQSGNVMLNGINKDRYNLTDTTITGKSITLYENARSANSAEFSSVYMKADSLTVMGSGSGQIIIGGTSTGEFNSSSINERGNLVINQGASMKLGDLTLGGTEYYYYPGMEAYDAGHLTVNGNDAVKAGAANLIRSGSSLNIQNGGKILMGSDTDTSGVANCSLFVAQGATLTAESGATITLDGSLVVASGSTLWSGDTTGSESLITTTGVNGTVILQDGATVGSYVHDTGERQITKSEIVDSIKAGFGTGDNVQYLYQIGANVNLGSLTVESNEIIQAGAGANVTIDTIADSAHVLVTGGTVDITSATADAGTPVTIGSYNDNTATNTSAAAVRLDASTLDEVTIKANSGTGELKTASGETTVIGSNVSIEAATVKVEEAGTTLVNNGQINAAVAAGEGSTVKGSGVFNSGLTLNQGSTLIVGNSPGLMTINGTTTIDAAQAVFSIAGGTAATAGRNGWGSGSYSNILVQSGDFTWLGTTQLTLEMAASYAPEEGTQLSFNLMKFIVADKDNQPGVTSVIIGSTNLLASENGTIDGITIAFSDQSSVDGTSLAPWMKDMKLNYTTTTDATGKYITVTLNGTAGIPEPSSAILGIIALSGMVLRRKRLCHQ